MTTCTCCTPEAALTRESDVPARPVDERRDPNPGCGCGDSCGCGTGDQPPAEVGARDREAERQLQT